MALIRLVNLDDLYAVYEVEQAAFGGGYAYNVIRQYFDLFSDTFLVAEDSEAGIVGYVLAGPHHPRKQAWILTLAVKPDFQRGGLGSQLMDQIHADLQSQGITKLLLTTSPQKTHLIRFYEKLDYTVTLNDPNYFGEDKARVVMTRELG